MTARDDRDGDGGDRDDADADGAPRAALARPAALVAPIGARTTASTTTATPATAPATPATTATPAAVPAAPAPIATLVAAVRAGDRAAFAALYHRFARVVHAVVLARVRYADAADVVQDVFLVALERLAELRDPAAFPGWLLQIARHRAADAARAPRPAPEAATAAAAAEVALAADPVPGAEARQALAAIRALPEAYRETLIMRLCEGLTGPEIAERTGLAPGSVRVNLHRGMAMLRERLGAPRPAPEAEEGEP